MKRTILIILIILMPLSALLAYSVNAENHFHIRAASDSLPFIEVYEPVFNESRTQVGDVRILFLVEQFPKTFNDKLSDYTFDIVLALRNETGESIGLPQNIGIDVSIMNWKTQKIIESFTISKFQRYKDIITLSPGTDNQKIMNYISKDNVAIVFRIINKSKTSSYYTTQIVIKDKTESNEINDLGLIYYGFYQYLTSQY